MLSRRDLVGRLAAGTAAALALGIPRASSAASRLAANAATTAGEVEGPTAEISTKTRDNVAAVETESAPGSTNSAPWELLHPLTAGALVTHGWRVAGLSPVVHGACVLTLQNQRGRTHRVHMCRNDGTPQGLVYTERLDLVVMNGGQGDLPTDEGLAQAVAEVAHVLAANEEHREEKSLVVALLPHAERLRLYGAGADAKLR